MSTPTDAATDALARALARAAVYRFLAEAFLYPHPGRLQRLRQDLPKPETLELAGAAAALAPLREVARRIGEATDASLESGFIDTFGHTTPEAYPPLETRYGSAHPFQESQDLGDVAAFYEAFGLRVRPGTGERIDHIALELEFLHLLALKEAWARERGDESGAETSLTTSRRFFEDHPGRWGTVFSGLIARKAPDTLLRSLGSLLGAVLQADRDVLKVAPRPVSPEPIPVPPEPSPDEIAETPLSRGLCG
jgi:TorA maturation chaperone TorD